MDTDASGSAEAVPEIQTDDPRPTMAGRRVVVSLGVPSPPTLGLLVVLIVAAWLRFTGLDWGGNLYLHPDERFQTIVVTSLSWPDGIAAYFDSQRSTLNPYNQGFTTYIYGTVPLFMAKLADTVSGMSVYGDAHLPGRFLSSLCDLFSIVLVFLTGRRIFSPAVGLVAAALLGVTVLSIQTAHFFVPDAFVMLFCLAAFYLALRADAGSRWWWYAATGLIIGLAVSSKLTALPILMTLAIPVGERWRQTGWRSMVRSSGRPQVSPIVGSVIAVVIAILTFRIGQPYAFLGPSPLSFRLDPRWVDDLRYWRVVQSGASDTPPNLQWADRTPVLFGLKNLVLWGMGPLLGVTVVAGLVWAIVALAAWRQWPPLWLAVLVAWPTFHLLYFGAGFVQTMRYFLPAYPFLILIGAALLVRIAHLGRERGWPTLNLRLADVRPAALPLGWLPATVVVIGTLLYAIAFTGIYTRPTTRETASRWIYETVPPGSVIATEHWDDGIPVGLPGFDQAAYPGFQLELFFLDDQAKLDTLLGQLDRADYIALTSNRLYTVIPRLPERYPMTSAYYRLLLSGELGFDLERTFTSYPSLGGVSIDDGSAEEAFTVYDHPEVLIFHKRPDYDRESVAAQLQAALGTGGIAVPLPEVDQSLLMMSDEERVTQQSSGTWSQIFSPTDLANRFPVLVWYLVLQIMALAVAPFCWRVLPGLPDRGWAVAKTLGLLGVAYAAWLLASVHAIPFGPNAVALGVLAVVALSATACRGRWAMLGADLRRRWRPIVTVEILFVVAFLGVVWLRMQNPDLWHPDRGGEKPMDFAYLNAVVRSTHFPPYDPWFAGGFMHYYYFGYVIWASVIRLTGIVPEVAYNLAVPSIFALVVVNTWSVALALLTRIVREVRSRSPWRLPLLALIAPVLVGVIGNLSLVSAIGRSEFGFRDSLFDGRLPNVPGLPALAGGIWSALTQHPALPPDLYWPATRIIPGTVNEFPAFSVLFADLHAHLMAMPLATAALALVVHLVLVPPGSSHRPAERSPTRDDAFAPAEGWLRRWVGHLGTGLVVADPALLTTVILAGFLTSALYATNTWDYPTYLALFVGAFAIGRGVRSAWGGSYAILRDMVLFALAVVVAGRILFWPFYAHFHSALTVIGTDERTGLSDYLTINGVFLVVIAGFLGTAVARFWSMGRRVRLTVPARVSITAGDRERSRGATIGLSLASRHLRSGALFLIAVLVALALSWAADSLALFVVSGLGVVWAAGWVYRNDRVRLLLVALLGIVLMLTMFAEHYTVGGDVGRQNIVFKLYLQIWVLLAIVAAITIASFIAQPGRLARPPARLWAVAVVLVLLGGMVYPVVATGPRVGDRFASLPPTLDGMAYMDTAVYTAQADDRAAVAIPLADDLAAIEWLRQRIAGSPVILEAETSGYRWGSRVSVYTGLPTVLGWDWHETQQRPGFGDLVNRRRTDVTDLFAADRSFESITPLLDRYHVRLIYAGPLERAWYGDEGLAKFQDAADRGLLDVIYRADGVTIYAYGD